MDSPCLPPRPLLLTLILMDELRDVISAVRETGPGQADRIRALRVEFGFDPDDAPTAHLRPLFGAAAA